MHEFIPVNEPLLDGNEKKYLIECIDTKWISSEGPFVARFEEEMAAYVGRKYGIAVSNGTAALETTMQALEIAPGSEVILPSHTIISCAQAIVKAGLVPITVDCNPDTWNMDETLLEEKITEKTKAIMVVHIYGIAVNMEEVYRLAEKYQLLVIEDAAQAIGLEYKGHKCGSLGTISIFSFYPNKHITCGEGGMVLTDDEHLAERCRMIRNLCFQPGKRRFLHEEIGSNFRMTNMQAALGIAQLEKIEHTVQRKMAIGNYYQQLLEDIPGIKLPVKHMDYCKNIYWVFGLVLKAEVDFDAQFAMQFLKERKIGTRPFFYPIHKQPVFQKMGYFKNDRCPHAEQIAERGFYIPSGLAITKEQMEFVAEEIQKLMK